LRACSSALELSLLFLLLSFFLCFLFNDTPTTEIYTLSLHDALPISFLLHPFISFYTTRGCPALCTFCMWPQTLSGHAWRTRSTDNVAREVKQALEYFPQMKEIFFDDDTFNIRKDRVLELSAKLKPLKFRWSSTARVHSDE